MGYKIKKKKNSTRSLGNMEEKKGGEEGGREAENRRKEARDVACEGAQSNPLLFIR